MAPVFACFMGAGPDGVEHSSVVPPLSRSAVAAGDAAIERGALVGAARKAPLQVREQIALDDHVARFQLPQQQGRLVQAPPFRRVFYLLGKPVHVAYAEMPAGPLER